MVTQRWYKLQLVPALRSQGRNGLHQHINQYKAALVQSGSLALDMNQSGQDRWLDGMPYKELVWHSGFEAYRKYAPDNMVALQVEVAVLNRLLNSNDPIDIINKLSVTAAWLDARM